MIREVFCAPCYGTKLPQKNQLHVGIQTHALFKRYLEQDFGKVRSLQHFFQLSYGVSDWFSLDLKGGAGYIKQHPLDSDELDYPDSFAGGYGFRIKLLDDQKARIRAVFGFQHISVHPKSTTVEGIKNESLLDDWQVSLIVSKDIYELVPYLGVKWSRLDYVHRQAGERKRKMSDLTKSTGVILGIDIPFFFESWLNIEGHLLDEQALSLSITFEL